MGDILDAAERYVNDAGLTGTFDPLVADKTRAVDDALREYTAARPRDKVATATVSADITIDLEALTDWAVGSSIVKTVWLDWSGTWADVIKTPQSFDDWDTIQNPTDGQEYLFWRVGAPAAAGTIGICFTALHVETSVPVVDRQAVGKLAASNMCLMVAAHYAETSKSSIGADSFLGAPQSREWRDLARDLRKQYSDATGAGKDGIGIDFASASAAPDRDDLTGHDYGRLIYDDKGLT